MYKLIAMSAVVTASLVLCGCGGGEETQPVPEIPDTKELKEQAGKAADKIDEAKDAVEEALE